MESTENRGQADAAPLRLEDLVSSVQAAQDVIRAAEANSGFEGTRAPPFRKHLPVGLHPDPQVRQCDWKHFKSDPVDSTPCVVDILVAGADLPLQVRDEVTDRNAPPLMMPWHRPPPASASVSGTSTPEEREVLQQPQEPPQLPKSPDEEQWIHRVRIRSAAVLKVLNAVSGHTFDITKAHTFMRPFAFLLYYHEKVRACIRSLEMEAKGTPSRSEDGPSSGIDRPGGLDVAEDRDDQDNTGRILEELRAYEQFVDDRILSDYSRFQNSTDSETLLRYDDLWCVFRPGDLVYLDPLGDGAVTRGKQDLQSQAKQRIMRVVSISPHTAPIDGHGFYRGRYFSESRSAGPSSTNFKLLCYWLDFNGDSFIPEWYTFNVYPFPEKIPIRSLHCRPIRFVDRSLDLLKAGIDTGRKVLNAIQHKRMSFDGPCLLYEPNGETAVTFKGEPLKDPERYDGEVYIDLKEAIKTRLYWSLHNHGPRPFEIEPTIVVEEFPVMKPTIVNGRAGPTKQHRDLVVHHDAVGMFQGNDYNKIDPCIMRKGGIPLHAFPFRDEDFALLPRRIYGYLLRYRVFMALDVNYMEPILPRPNALNSICLDDNDKRMLQSAVHGYFRRGFPQAAISSDPSGGSRKNQRGTIVMIQGAPGSGKTAAVEAIMQTYNKPVFALGADDFVNESEETMVELEVAKAWNCPVLVDDVDVFLPRSRHDSKMNQQVTSRYRYLE